MKIIIIGVISDSYHPQNNYVAGQICSKVKPAFILLCLLLFTGDQGNFGLTRECILPAT